MPGKSANEIRDQYIGFFETKGHTFVPSTPVVPTDDPTLMFTNAGMNQFKDVFLGIGSRPYCRATNTQKCIRAGGKHNDLDDVGHDTYHHTFFEMLGNWSFGDYFKKEAIAWAWELLTEVWGIDKRRLHATYFEGDAKDGLEPDDEARQLWASVTDIDPAHIHPGNKKDNFWEMGDTGPCGPCSEIHIDMTPDLRGGELINAGDARVMEIWNLVFIQYNRAVDGKLSPLPARHVDTGMGFERICAVLDGMAADKLGEISNYDTDVFAPIFAGIARVTGAAPYTGLLEDGNETNPDRTAVMRDVAYRVVADHVRCLTFALTDGAVPGNEGRGYVLRRILRRAVRYGRQYLDAHEPFLCKLVPVVVEAMSSAFPELNSKPDRVAELVREEEESFIRTLDRGIALFEEAAVRASGRFYDQNEGTDLGRQINEYVRTKDRQQPGNLSIFRTGLIDWRSFPGLDRPSISGPDAFKLHDTYGFPIDLTEIMAREHGMTVDIDSYEQLMEEARQRARAGGKADVSFDLDIPGELPTTDDSGKYATLSQQVAIVGWVQQGTFVTEGTLQESDRTTVGLVLDRTCAYAEQGGQVGDAARITTETGEFSVETTKRAKDCVLHLGSVSRGQVAVGQQATITIDSHRRQTMCNHTATHLLNWALREVLEAGGGGKVDQKGSLVDPDRTRFDFSHNKPLTAEEIERVEALCNEQIRADRPVYAKEVPQAEARQINSLRAVFGEKYPDMVRVVSAGGDIDAMLNDPQNPEWMHYPVEFCGGTHVQRTSQIGAFALTAEEAVAKGIRRVVGITGERAERAIAAGKELLERAEAIKAGPADEVAEGLAELQKKLADAEIPVRDRVALRYVIAELQQRVKQQSKQQAAASAGALRSVRQALLDEAERVGGTAVVVGALPEVPVEQVREAADWLRAKAGSAAVCLATATDGKVTLVVAMTADLVKKGLKAGELVKEIAPAVDGRGGGKPDLAQAGGKNPAGISTAMTAATTWIKSRLTG